MTQITLKQSELPIFIRIANQVKQGYHYITVDNKILLTTSTTFLIEMGYL